MLTRRWGCRMRACPEPWAHRWLHPALGFPHPLYQKCRIAVQPSLSKSSCLCSTAQVWLHRAGWEQAASNQKPQGPNCLGWTFGNGDRPNRSLHQMQCIFHR